MSSYGINDLEDLLRGNPDLGVKTEKLKTPEQVYNERAGKSATRRIAGKKAREHGQAFEKEIADYTALMLVSRLAEFQRNQFDMRPKVIGGELLFVPVSKAPVDFSFVMLNGIAGKFDCKSTQQKSAFSWPQEQYHQVVELRELYERTGGVSPAFALVKWRVWDEVLVHWIDTIDGRVYRDDGFFVDGLDWLSIVETMI
jgi:penicillin-binding protein-related factor A (putative recombinase)